MKKLLKRLIISLILAALFFVLMHIDEHPRPDRIINLATVGVFLFCALYSLILE